MKISRRYIGFAACAYSILALLLGCGAPAGGEAPFASVPNGSLPRAAGGSMNVGAGGGGSSEAGASGQIPLVNGQGGMTASTLPLQPLVDGEGTNNLFSELLGRSQAEVDAKLTTAVNRFFGIGTGEPATPTRDSGYRCYYELPQDNSMAFIWAADSNDIRSEGMSYGMTVAVQMGMQTQFDRLWKFAQTYMQYPASTGTTAWRYYFKWQGRVDTANAASWTVTYGATTVPAPDGDEYFAAALYLANRRWGSAGAVNYLQEANNIAAAMLNNAPSGGRNPIIHRTQNMVVFVPNGASNEFSDPSYHLPAFYELFALDGPAGDATRWRQVAETSRAYLVASAHATTGLHPDYATFAGAPTRGGGQNSAHDQFQFDAWRVVMNMALDYAWFVRDARMQAQVGKYHAFFDDHLDNNNVQNALFFVDGSNPSGGGSTALTATLAAGALASSAANRTEFVDNLWNVGQQQGEFRYYQESVYLLGLLATAGKFDYDW